MVFAECIRLAYTALALEDAIERSLFRDQIQGALQRFARCFGAERFWGSPQLRGIQPGVNLNERHV